MSASANEPSKGSTELARERTKFAFERTRFAADRTLMAWVRTSLSLITFGFALTKFLQFIQGSETTDEVAGAEETSQLGLAMAVLGTSLLILATIEYVLYLGRTCRETNRKFPLSTTLFAAGLLSLVGLLVLLEMLFQIGPF